ncbi:hypothetical protein [Nocardia sp. CY41]|uniref:hypothetical protein n=1 Tax=Nocardia sp. CY41 TaxID=2608686 RepID=UPI0013584856|nr:hypothetical protein [Nocardia sp. CY41]
MSGRRNHKRNSSTRRPDTVPAIRYPARSVLDMLLPAMITRRSSAPSLDTGLVHIWGFTGTGEDDSASAAGFAEFSPNDTPTVAGSPILDIAGRMMAGMHGRLWGFGLAHQAAADTIVHGIDNQPDMTSASPDGSEEVSTTEEVWAASIFDARGREITQLRYVHLPELEPITFDSDTLDRRSTIHDWIDRVQTGVISAHVWAAALALDAQRNRAVLAQLEQRLLS